MNSVAKGFLSIAAVVQGSCVALDEIPADQCGNNVVETRSDLVVEDCDGYVDPTVLGQNGLPLACGEPGEANACKFIHDNEHDCPVFYVPGSDGRCRLPSGTFLPYPLGSAFPGVKPLVADFDGNGDKDVFVEASFDGLPAVYYFSNGEITDLTGFFGQLQGVGVGSLNGDAYSDIASGIIPEGGDGLSALVVQLGREEPGFDQKFYAGSLFPGEATFLSMPLSSVNFPFENWQMNPLGVAYPNLGGDPDCEGKAYCVCFDIGCSTKKGAFPNLAEGGAIMSTARDRGLVLSGLGGYRMLVSNVDYVGANQPVAVESTIVELADLAKVISEPVVEDLDGDGLLDLAAVGTRPIGGKHQLAVYVLLGKPPLMPTDPGPFHWSITDRLTEAQLLGDPLDIDFSLSGVPEAAIGFLNDDAIADVVYPVVLEGGYGTAVLMGTEVGDPFDVAAVAGTGPIALADVNGDGVQDVLSTASNGTIDSLEVAFGGDERPLIATRTYLEGRISRLATSDLDGDGASDAIFSVRTDGLAPGAPQLECTNLDEVVVMYGSRLGLPEEPVVIGRTSGVRQILGGRFYFGGRDDPDVADSIGDFALSAACGATEKSLRAAVVAGRTDRLIFSPYGSTFIPAFQFIGDVGLGPNGGGDEAANDIVAFGLEQKSSDGPAVPGLRVFYGAGDAELVDEATLELPDIVDVKVAQAGLVEVDAVITPQILTSDEPISSARAEVAFMVVSAPSATAKEMTLSFGVRTVEAGTFTTVGEDAIDILTVQQTSHVARLVAADIDRDNDLDYVAVVGGKITFDGDEPVVTSAAVVFERDGDKFIPHELETTLGDVFVDAAVFNSDGARVAIATGLSLFSVQRTAAGFAIETLFDDGTNVRETEPDIGPGFFENTGIAAGDFTSDGLDDLLVLGEYGGIYVQKAVGDPF